MSDIINTAGVTESSEKNTPYWRGVWAILWKDLTLERHTKRILSVMFLYALSVVIMFNFALETNLGAARALSTGLLWATIILTGTLGLNRSLGAERDNGSLDAVLMSPIERSAIYVGKVASVSVFAIITELILVVVFTVFFNKPFWRPSVLLVLLLGTLGYVAIGVLITTMTIQAKGSDVLLPVLLLPLSLPLVLPAAMATSRLMLPLVPEWAEIQGAIAMVIIYDLIMLMVGFFTYNFVVET